MNRHYRFFYHYNKLLSKKQGRPVITVHWRGQCVPVNNIECMVDTKGRINKRQPFFVMTGKACRCIIINNNGFKTAKLY